MANVIAVSGNFTGGTTWQATATYGASTVLTYVKSTTTTIIYSPTFVGTNLDVVDGILMHCRQGLASQTGTITVELYDESPGPHTLVTGVTVNAVDLPAAYSWVFFKFAAPVVLDGGNYTVGLTGSVAGNGLFKGYSSPVTPGYWAKLLRKTTNVVPAANDVLFISGELTGAGTNNPTTVINDSVDTATTFGATNVGHLGTFQYANTPATNYAHRTKLMNVWSDGTLEMGTSSSPVDPTSTAALILYNTSHTDAAFTVRDGGNFIAHGNPKIPYAKLAADASAGATTFTTDAATGWSSGDYVVVASTTLSPTECEIKTMTGAAVGTSVPVPALSYAHSGTAPTQAEVINLTRNVIVTGLAWPVNPWTAFTYGSGMTTEDDPYIEADNVEFNLRKNQPQPTAGSVSFIDCSSFYGDGINSVISTLDHLLVSGCVFFRERIHVSATAGTDVEISDCILMQYLAAANTLELYDVGLTASNITVIGGFYASSNSTGIIIGEADAPLGLIDGLTVHSCYGGGIKINRVGVGTMSNLTVWRNQGRTAAGAYGVAGLEVDGAGGAFQELTLDGITAFGNGNNAVSKNVEIADATTLISCRLLNLALDSGTTYVCPTNLFLSDCVVVDTTFDGAAFSGTTGLILDGCVLEAKFIDWQFTTATDVLIDDASGTFPYVDSSFHNSIFALSGQSDMPLGSSLGSQKHGQVAGDNRTFLAQGTLENDWSIYRVTAPSERMTPNGLAELSSGVRLIPLDDGKTAQISVWVRTSTSGSDGDEYIGVVPALVLKANPAAGIPDDVVLDAYPATSPGEWIQLGGTTPAVADDAVLELHVVCDGTSGFINVDEWATQ